MAKTDSIDPSDIPGKSWVDALPKGVRPYLILMRADRPIGTWLLLLPCLWSMALAAPGQFNFYYALLFAVGAFVMRGAGCVMNDLADRNFDGQVKRTRTRPLPNGDVTPRQAILFMGGLCFIGLGVLVQFNSFTIGLAIASLGLVFIYPFCKRWTHWPQIVLGLAINWGALIGWSAMTGNLALPALCLYGAGLFWTLGYDTIYAHQDKEDDALIGLKSTALLLAERTGLFLWIFYGLTFALIGLGGYLVGLSVFFYAGMVCVGAHLLWQILKTDIHDPKTCLMVFKSNKWFGILVLAAILLGGAHF